MKHILAGFYVIMTLFAHTQETKKVTVKHENPWYTEKYSVLKSDTAVRCGNYKQLGYRNCLVIKGYYKNDKKDSIWTEYFWRTKAIKNQGAYKNDLKTGIWTEYFWIDNKSTIRSKGNYYLDKRIGIWDFYDRNVTLSQTYNYDTKELLYYANTDTTKQYDIKTDTGIVSIELDRPPMYIGGDGEVKKAMLITNMNYPDKAMENEISGTVLITFFIDKNGKATDHSVQEGIGGGCDEEALRVVKKIPDNWLPGILNGQLVTAKYTFKVKFMLGD